MELALEILSEMKGKGRGIAVLGDMLELGEYSVEAHQLIGKRVAELSVDLLLALGEEAPVLVESARHHGLGSERARVVEGHTEAISILRKTVRDGDWILVKGSRRMGMEKIVEGLTERKV
jgi:UDP-N-acetylmuramoyl-tripeptide--D-alanyl-D-alanine ligase